MRHISVYPVLIGVLLTGCGGRDSPAGGSHTMVLSHVEFVRHEANGTIEGFDLDNAVSTGIYPDPTGCGLPDGTSPDGEPGIDNMLSFTFETLVAVTGDVLDALLRSGIADGTLLIMFQLEGVDDPYEDSDVTIHIYKGKGQPLLATTGFLAPSQTFEIDTTTPMSTGRGYIEHGVFHGGPFTAEFPVKFFTDTVTMRLHEALIVGRVVSDPTGCALVGGGDIDASVDAPRGCGGDHFWLADALIGGSAEVSQVIEMTVNAGRIDGTYAALFASAPTFLYAAADSHFDPATGGCDRISTAIRIRTEPAYLLGEGR